MAGVVPRLLIFDVNETLTDLTPLAARFEEVGAPAHLLPTWFAGVLRDGFALTAAGGYADFADLATDGLRALLAGIEGWEGDQEEAARHVLAVFRQLPLHPDAVPGIRALHDAGFRLATMTNGSAAQTDQLLAHAGIRDCFTVLCDVSGPRCWKPAPRAYRWACEQAGARPAEAGLVAVHPWDVDGAQRAGLAGIWLCRAPTRYPRTMLPPTRTAADLRELPVLLLPQS
jgi:2-haloacid dehalogenase